MADRPFPWLCGNCGKKEVIMTATSYDVETRVKGQPHTLTIPLDMPVCQVCGEMFLTDKVGNQIDKVVREFNQLSSQ